MDRLDTLYKLEKKSNDNLLLQTALQDSTIKAFKSILSDCNSKAVVYDSMMSESESEIKRVGDKYKKERRHKRISIIAGVLVLVISIFSG